MSKNINQVFTTPGGAITTNLSNDLLYFGRSPYGASDDKAITFTNFAAQFLANITPITVAQGGTGLSSFTPYAVIVGGTTSTSPLQSIASVGTSGQVLTSNGASALPTFQTASVVPHHNFIYGGNFDTNPFQRYQTQTGSSATTTTKWFADRFALEKTAATTWGGGQVADAPTFADCGMIVANCLSITNSAIFTVSTSSYAKISYAVEGLDFRYLAQAPMTLSFWVKASVAGIYNVSFTNQGNDRVYASPYTINAANTWEFKTITLTSISAGSWNYSPTAVGIKITFVMSCGSDFFITANTWITGSGTAAATAGQANAFATANNVFRLALVQLEQGSTFTQFEKRSAADELLLVQRYYENCFPPYEYTARLTGDSTNYYSVGNSAVVAGIQYIDVKFMTPKTGNRINTLWSKGANLVGSVTQISDGLDVVATINGNGQTRFGFHFTNAASQYGGQFYWECAAELF